LKKRSKKLLLLAPGGETDVIQLTKVFWFFFSKKNFFLSVALHSDAPKHEQLHWRRGRQCVATRRAAPVRELASGRSPLALLSDPAN